MAQVNLDVHYHIGHEFQQLESIARQVGTYILERIVKKRRKPLTKKEKEQILLLYQENVNRMIQKSELISKLKDFAELEVPKKLVYSKEKDEKRFYRFLKVLENILSEKVEQKSVMLPSWSQIKEKTGNYFVLREMLRRRSNQSTWSRLQECKLLCSPARSVNV